MKREYRPVAAAICVCIALSLHLAAQDEPQFTKTVEIAPLRLTYRDLAAIIASSRDLIKSANRASSNRYEHEQLTVDDGRTKLELRQDFSEAAFQNGPPVGYTIDYDYRNEQAPISQVEIRLWDTTRSVSVSGESRNEVDALSSLLSQRFAEGHTYFGGLIIRGFGWAVLLWTSLLLFAIPPQLNERFNTPKGVMVLAAGFVVLQMATYLLPWDKWLAGTAVYSGSASWMERNAAEISFFGALGTLVTFVSLLLGIGTRILARLQGEVRTNRKRRTS